MGGGGRTILQRNPCCATTTRALNAQHMIHLLKDDNRPHDRTAGSTGEAVGYGSVYEVADSKPSWLPVEALAAVVEYHGTRAKGVWDQKLNVTHLSTTLIPMLGESLSETLEGLEELVPMLDVP